MLDHPEVLKVLFHPQRIFGPSFSTPDIRLIDVQVEPGIIVGGRLYPASATAPTILYFHGNGEIAANYDEIATLYTQLGITLLVMDYRAYGRSGGQPTGYNLLSDARAAFDALGGILEANGLNPPRLYVMGRSLGSAAAIEVARHAGQALAGLIIESGFADTFALLERLGARIEGGDEARHGFGNLDKIGELETPTLVIHGQRDVLIPPQEGKALFERCGANDKQLVLIPGGHHNDLMMVGMRKYFQAIERFTH